MAVKKQQDVNHEVGRGMLPHGYCSLHLSKKNLTGSRHLELNWVPLKAASFADSSVGRRFEGTILQMVQGPNLKMQ